MLWVHQKIIIADRSSSSNYYFFITCCCTISCFVAILLFFSVLVGRYNLLSKSIGEVCEMPSGLMLIEGKIPTYIY